MVPVAIVGGVLLNLVVMWDVFRTLILPRRALRRFRMTEWLDHSTWRAWSGAVRLVPSEKLREALLCYFGPLEILLHLLVWGVLLIAGYSWLRWGLGVAQHTGGGHERYGENLYSSASTFFTLGTGSIQPISGWERFVTIVEVGTGFGLLTLVIAYLPQLYSTFSRREVKISRFDQQAGTPPCALQLFASFARGNPSSAIPQRLGEWEEWAAEVLQGHMSYPVLAYFRSQRPGQSWVSTLTTLLDACALIQVGLEDIPTHPAELTFGMAQHAVCELCRVLGVQPRPPERDRLPGDALADLQRRLADQGYHLGHAEDAGQSLMALRSLYESYANALAAYLLVPLPGWLPSKEPSEQQAHASQVTT